MPSQGGSSADRGYHQDYIARIRYENTLPPPPGAPKLLEIPIEGVKYYTSPAFASRLARQQPLNIEADAELGMPIDLVGMPGVFEGDESSIQAPLVVPPLHPKDKSLLRPLSELGKPKFSTQGHSFLRRTEYISSDAKLKVDAAASPARTDRNAISKTTQKQVDTSKDDPLNLLRHVVKGFNIAYPQDAYKGEDDSKHLRGAQPTPAELEAWKNPKHPTKPDLKLLESYPVLPDIEAMPDSGSFTLIKYQGNPTAGVEGHDDRLDVALLQPAEIEGSEEFDYELYLPKETASLKRIKRKFDDLTDSEENDEDDEAQYQNKAGQPAFKYLHHRTYDNFKQTNSLEHPYTDVALALHDPDGTFSDTQKGAYFYPINMKMSLKAKRSKKLAALGMQSQMQEDEPERSDEIDLVIRDADDEEREKRREHQTELTGDATRIANGEG